MTDATIIGGGPAGSVAALILARGGWDITLIEQHRFPRDKVCGECLSALGIDVLRRAGLLETLRELRPIELRQTVLVAADGTEATLRLPRAMWGVSRSALDTALLRAAAAAGARVMQPARCERIESTRLQITVRDLVSNQVSNLRPQLLMLADGKGLLDPHPLPTGDLGVKAHFTGVDEDCRDAIFLFALDGHYVGLAPIEGGRWNLAMSVPAAKLKPFGGDLEGLFGQILEENVGLRRRLRRAARFGPWLASALPRFAVRRRWPQGVIPIGNAAAALEPIGGEGMGLAMRSAEIVAAELIAHGEDYCTARLRRRMSVLWAMRRTAARAAAVCLSRPGPSRAIVGILGRTGELAAAPTLLSLGKRA
jgi:2-polyprenyl-6-methoxyphenol hydroxylase-like FAD-dependent oxidoreductase